MILNDIKDYHKHKLFIPRCEETITLDKSIAKYQKMKKQKKVYSRKNELELEAAVSNITHHLGKVKALLIKKGLWG